MMAFSAFSTQAQVVSRSNYYFKTESLKLVSNQRKDTLKVVHLHDSTLVQMPLWLKECENIELLDVSGTQIKYFPKWMAGLSKLEKIVYNGLVEPRQVSSMVPMAAPEIDGYPQFPKLPQVKHLEMRFHGWVHAPGSIRRLKSLESLDLSDNKIKQLPSFLRRFRALEKLSLDRNELEIQGGFPKLPALKSLSLSKNDMADLPDNFEQLPKLISLDLSSNKISDELLSGRMMALGSLQYLNLKGNELHAFPQVALRMAKLKSLNLSFNELDRLPANGFEVMKSLTDLDLSYNQLKDDLGGIAFLPLLQRLDLSHNKLYTLSLSAKNMDKLTGLQLESNAFEHFPVEVFDFKNLVRCDLSFNRIDQRPTPGWQKQSIKYLWLNLKGNPLQGDSLNDFRADCADSGVMLAY